MLKRLYCTYNADTGYLCVSNLNKPNANNFTAHPATLDEATDLLLSYGYTFDHWADASDRYEAPVFVASGIK